jgi:hypothetical protein
MLTDPVLACNDEWLAYSSISHSFGLPVASVWNTTVTYHDTTTVVESWSCSSTCGNVCYADVKPTDFVTTTSVVVHTIEQTDYLSYTGPKPTCTVPLASCTSMWEVWSQSTSVYVSWATDWSATGAEPPWPSVQPGCEYCSTTGCWILAEGTVELLYWPEPTTVSRDMCTDVPDLQPYKESTCKSEPVILRLCPPSCVFEMVNCFGSLDPNNDWPLCCCLWEHFVRGKCVSLDPGSKRQ